jgi:hypothetical protein
VVTRLDGAPFINDYSGRIFHPVGASKRTRLESMHILLEVADFSFLKPPKTGFYTPDQAFAQHIYGSPEKEDLIQEQLDNCFEEDLGLIG